MANPDGSEQMCEIEADTTSEPLSSASTPAVPQPQNVFQRIMSSLTSSIAPAARRRPQSAGPILSSSLERTQLTAHKRRRKQTSDSTLDETDTDGPNSSSSSVSATPIRSKQRRDSSKAAKYSSTADTASEYCQKYKNDGIRMPANGKYDGSVYCIFCKKYITAKASTIQDHLGVDLKRRRLPLTNSFVPGAEHERQRNAHELLQIRAVKWKEFVVKSHHIAGMHLTYY